MNELLLTLLLKPRSVSWNDVEDKKCSTVLLLVRYRSTGILGTNPAGNVVSLSFSSGTALSGGIEVASLNFRYLESRRISTDFYVPFLNRE